MNHDDGEHRSRVSEILTQLDYTSSIITTTSEYWPEYVELTKADPYHLTNSELKNLGQRLANLQEKIRGKRRSKATFKSPLKSNWLQRH